MNKGNFHLSYCILLVFTLCCTLSISAFAETQSSDVTLLSSNSSFDLVYGGAHHLVPYDTLISRYNNPKHYTVWYAQYGLLDYAEYFEYSEMNPGTPDGKFGPKTESAFISFQKHCDLNKKNGYVGNETWGALENCLHGINGY